MLILSITEGSPEIVCEVDGREILRVKLLWNRKKRPGGGTMIVKRVGFIAGDEVKIRREKPKERK